MSSSDTAAADGGGDDGGGGGGRTKRIVFHLDDADSNPFAASQTPITTLSPTAQVVPTQHHVVSLTSDNKRVDSHDDIKQPFAAPSDAAVERVSSAKAENTRTISASAPSTLRSPKSAAAGAISPYAISLLSSSAVFRSYHITDRTGKVDFQDIRLFATFPHDSIPDDSKETETAAAAALPSLHWGPPSSGRLPKSASYQSIALHSVERIIAGKQTATFQSPSSLVALLSSSRCFSIIAQTDTLHLEALSEDVRDAWVEQLAEAASVISQRTIAVERSANEAEDARVREQRRQRSIEETNRSYSESHLNKVYATASSKLASSTGKTSANSGAVKSISEILTSAPAPAPAPPIAAAAIPPLTVRAALPIFVTSEGVAREKTEMQMDMRLCLREMVTLHAQWIINAETDKLHPADSEFTDSEKRHTTHLPTPEHPSSNFEYKAYAGTIFTRLRYHYSIPDQAYLHSVAGSQGFADFVANSKSKSFFFYTYDGAYMMKSMTKEEVNFLRLHVLRPYYYHLIEHIDSLLSKIFGLYRIVKHGIKTYFMVMKNVFFGDKPIHVRFDLKGSTYGRQAKEKEKEQETPVLKDIDFNQGTMLHGQRLEPVYLRIGMKKQALVNMLTKDVTLLSDLAIMDYSLLVGIHYRSRETNKNRSASIDGVTVNGSVSASGVVSASASDGQMNYGTKKHEFVVPRAAIQKVERMIENNSNAQAAPTATTPRGMPLGSANDADNTEKSADSLSVPSESRRPQLSRYASSTFFTEDDGGVASVNEDGREGNEVYYLGIIDILQVYNTRKSLEYMVKAMTINANAVSVAPPKYYADRFLHAITERIKGVDDSWEK